MYPTAVSNRYVADVACYKFWETKNRRVSGSCRLSRPIKSEHEKELLVWFEEAILIYTLVLSLAWSGASLVLTVCLPFCLKE